MKIHIPTLIWILSFPALVVVGQGTPSGGSNNSTTTNNTSPSIPDATIPSFNATLSLDSICNDPALRGIGSCGLRSSCALLPKPPPPPPTIVGNVSYVGYTSCSDQSLLQTACLLDLPLIISSSSAQGIAVSACSSIIRSCHLSATISNNDSEQNSTIQSGSTSSNNSNLYEQYSTCSVLRGMLPTSRMAYLTRQICSKHQNILPCLSCFSQPTDNNGMTTGTNSISNNGLACPRLLDTYAASCQILSGIKECEPWNQMCELIPIPAAYSQFCPGSPPTSLSAEQSAVISSLTTLNNNTSTNTTTQRTHSSILPTFLVSANATIFNTSAPNPMSDEDDPTRDPETRLYLHTGTLDYILFRDFVPRTKMQYFGACLFTFALSGFFFVVGWLRRFRTKIHARHRRRLREKEIAELRRKRNGTRKDERNEMEAKKDLLLVKEDEKDGSELTLNVQTKNLEGQALMLTSSLPPLPPAPVSSGIPQSPTSADPSSAVLDMNDLEYKPLTNPPDLTSPNPIDQDSRLNGNEAMTTQNVRNTYPASVFSFYTNKTEADASTLPSQDQEALKPTQNQDTPFPPQQDIIVEEDDISTSITARNSGSLSRQRHGTTTRTHRTHHHSSRRRTTRKHHNMNAVSPTSPAMSLVSATSGTTLSRSRTTALTTSSSKLKKWYLSVELHHIERSLWRTLEVFLGYCLILIVMTFNAGFLLAALMGVLVGSYTLERTDSSVALPATGADSGGSLDAGGITTLGRGISVMMNRVRSLSRKGTLYSRRKD